MERTILIVDKFLFWRGFISTWIIIIVEKCDKTFYYEMGIVKEYR